jgi:hypothetical protein
MSSSEPDGKVCKWVVGLEGSRVEKGERYLYRLRPCGFVFSFFLLFLLYLDLLLRYFLVFLRLLPLSNHRTFLV